MPGHYGDGTHYGALVDYGTTEGTADSFLVDVEAQDAQLMVRCSPRIKFTATATTRTTFRLFGLRLLAGLRSQLPDRFVAYPDVLMQRISPRMKHTGSEFVISTMRVVAHVKHKDPKG